MEGKINKIIESAIAAPSGENCQPWRFLVNNNKLSLFNDPNSDTSLYNYKQHGSLIAHGAAIENMIIAASNFGLKTQVNYFPSLNNENHIADLEFTDAVLPKDTLYDSIKKRSTNRKKYNSEVLTTDILNKIKNTSFDGNYGEIKLLTSRDKIDAIADALSINERIIFENKHLHKFFFDHVRWTEKEDNLHRNGFFIKTLELNDKQLKGLSVFKNWNILKFLNVFGISKVIAKDNQSNYSSSSALGIITLSSKKNIDYVNAGRLFERMWLEITRLELSLHPITGVLFLTKVILDNQKGLFSKKHQNMLLAAYNKIRSEFDVKEDEIFVLFRIGKSEPPSARASRKDISDFIIS